MKKNKKYKKRARPPLKTIWLALEGKGGESRPPFEKGLHRLTRHNPKKLPFIIPYLSIHLYVYSEQVGENRQKRSERIGERKP